MREREGALWISDIDKYKKIYQIAKNREKAFNQDSVLVPLFTVILAWITAWDFFDGGFEEIEDIWYLISSDRL